MSQMFWYLSVFGLVLSTPIHLQGILENHLGDDSAGFMDDVTRNSVLLRRHLTQDNPTEKISMSTPQCDPSVQDCSGLSSECSDDPPPNAAFECSKYSALGLCQDLGELYCQQSCGTCGCQDIQVPGAECSTIVSGGQCEDDAIKGIFCAKSCGFCGQSSSITNFDQGDCSAASNLQCDLNALVAFKNTLTAGSSLFSSWSGSNPCDWIYVLCSKFDGQNRVSELQLNFYNTGDDDKMAGQIVSDFSKMRYLKVININNQENLRGKLYSQFSVLDKLEELSIYKTGISGTLPAEYSTMSNLNEFTTSFNSLRGTLPPEYSALKELQYFRQGANQLSNTLPIIYSVWENIIRFDIGENDLSGILPPEYSSFLFIDKFHLQYNNLVGTLPTQYSAFGDVTSFSVRGNSLSGTLPQEYSNMQDVQHFKISYINDLTGTLPVEYSTFRNIEEFFASNTGLTSQIPDEWSVFSSSADIKV